MFIKSAKRPKACNKDMEKHISAGSYKRQRHKIGQNDFEKKIRRTHVAGADAFAGACRMMNTVAELAHQAGAVQHKAVENILDNVMAHAHEQHGADEIQCTQMRRARKSQPGILKGSHGWKQDKNLVEEHAG